MTVKILQNTYCSLGYTLLKGYTGLTIDSTAGVGGKGVLSRYLATIDNYGTIRAGNYAGHTGPSLTTGVSLTAGGSVNNESGGYIGGLVAIKGASGTVVNSGQIDGGGAAAAVDLYAGGTLNNGASEIYAVIHGGVYVQGGSGTVTNDGTITSGDMAVKLLGGGAVTNGDTAGLSGFIRARQLGVYAAASATVTNFGTIQGVGEAGVGLKKGGAVANGSVNLTKALIDGAFDGLYVKGAAGEISNFGTIVATNATHANGVYLGHGGSVTNGSISDRAAVIEAYDGVTVEGAGATVANFGIVFATGAANSNGAYLGHGGSLINGGVSDRTASINGYNGVTVKGAVATVANFGVIDGDGVPTGAGITTGTYNSASGVYIGDGGNLTNGGLTDQVALISGGYQGVVLSKTSSASTITNFGTIEATAAFTEPSGEGQPEVGISMQDGGKLINGGLTDTRALIYGYNGVFDNGAGATVANFGTIEGVGVYARGGGLDVTEGGNVTNGAAGDTVALITGANGLILVGGGVANFGTIRGVVGYGAYLAGGVTITNGSVSDTRALAEGTDALIVKSGAGTVNNFATLHGDDAATGFAGVVLQAGGLINNGSLKDAKAMIEGYAGVVVTGAATVTNFGTIAGDGGVALQFNTASDRLIAEAGSTFIGAVKGGGGTLELAAGTGTITGLGGPISGFGAYFIDKGGSWSLTGTNTLSSGDPLTIDGTVINLGSLTLSAAVTNAGVLEAGAGVLTLSGSVSGKGIIEIADGRLTFASAFNGNVTFAAASTGTLELAHSQTFTGALTGFSLSGATFLDLDDIAFGSAIGRTYSGTTTGGVLTITSGAEIARIRFVGNYLASGWNVASDGHGGILIWDPARLPATDPPSHAAPLASTHTFIQVMAAMATPTAAASPSADVWRASPTMLARPRTQIS